ARRIELCTSLELDGLTPSKEDLQAARAAFPHLIIHVLIRPRPGDFCYSEAEINQMEKEIETALEEGADGIVIGCLTPEGEVDEAAMERLVRTAKNRNARVSITFHRAFDRCPNPAAALERILLLGCDRILTSGGKPTAEEGIRELRALQEQADGRIILLPGGGVTPRNAAKILSATGCQEIHASASCSIAGKKVTSFETVAEILQQICG
ncbi:MAG: copper homeostasis protein CutC, partial [Bacteroidales bacterium]|nr:copper homeostasis protein CutC [Bacteroidales bacterium]